MQGKIILAESGGTKTDWWVYHDGVVVAKYLTGSFHPAHLEGKDVADVLQLIPELDDSTAQLKIYSAGCFREENKQILRDKLSAVRANVEVKSDIDAAIEATGYESGWVAILGTGSVLIHFDKSNVQLYGGLGWETGDEGSGFYFGKLVVEQLKSGQFVELIDEVQKAQLLPLDGKPDSKFIYADLAKQLNGEAFRALHFQNVNTFFQRYVLPNDVREISIVGSYSFYNQDVLLEVCELYSLKISCLIERPIFFLQP